MVRIPRHSKINKYINTSAELRLKSAVKTHGRDDQTDWKQIIRILWRLLPAPKGEKGGSEDARPQLLRVDNSPDGFIYVSIRPLWRLGRAEDRWCCPHPPPASASPPLGAPGLFADAVTSRRDQGRRVDQSQGRPPPKIERARQTSRSLPDLSSLKGMALFSVLFQYFLLFYLIIIK